MHEQERPKPDLPDALPQQWFRFPRNSCPLTKRLQCEALRLHNMFSSQCEKDDWLHPYVEVRDFILRKMLVYFLLDEIWKQSDFAFSCHGIEFHIHRKCLIFFLILALHRKSRFVKYLCFCAKRFLLHADEFFRSKQQSVLIISLF